MPLITPDIQHMLDAETDARFWAQTGYNPGRKLDPKNPADKAMIPVWLDVYKKVKTAWSKGALAITYDHPAVQSLLAEAGHEIATALDSIGKSFGALLPEDKAAHDLDASAAHARAGAATAKAATYQPPTVSPVIAQHAVDQIATHAADPSVTVTPILVSDATQASRAPVQAAQAQVQIAAPDAPAPPPKPGTAKTLIVIGGCLAAIMAGALLNRGPDPESSMRYRRIS